MVRAPKGPIFFEIMITYLYSLHLLQLVISPYYGKATCPNLFFVIRVTGSWNSHFNVESWLDCTLSSVGEQKKQCGGLVPLYEGLQCGGSSVKEGVKGLS